MPWPAPNDAVVFLGGQVTDSATTPDSASRMTLLQVKVKPNARTSALEERDGLWTAQLKSPPVDGRANAELIALVAERFGCRKSQVSIRSGASGRTKWVRIDD